MIRVLCAILFAFTLACFPVSDVVGAQKAGQPEKEKTVAAQGTGQPEIVKLDHSEPFGDWTLHCGKDQKGTERCILGIGLWDEEKRRIAGIVLQKTPDGTGTLARFSLPLGINLIRPAALQMGEKINGFAITHCDPQGCHGHLLLNEEQLKQFRDLHEGVLLMKLLDERTIRIPFSLNGTRAGMAKIK